MYVHPDIHVFFKISNYQGCKQRIFYIFSVGKKALNSRWGHFAF